MKAEFIMQNAEAGREKAGACRRLNHSLRAFTLIELITVISVMAILAALVIPITGAVNKQKIIKRAYSELSQIETAMPPPTRRAMRRRRQRPDCCRLRQLGLRWCQRFRELHPGHGRG